jgi:hypothetical protein
VYVRGKPSILHKLIFELRYRHGYTYLDRCGKTINAIMSSHPEWMPRSEHVSPQNAPMVSAVNQSVFNFSSKKLDFSLEQSIRSGISAAEVESFCSQVDQLSTIVITQLSLKEFERIGLRSWYIFPCTDKDEAEKWLTDLGAFQIAPELGAIFGGEIRDVAVATVVSGTDRDYRIGFNSVEKLALIDLGSEVMAVRTSALSRDQGRAFAHHQKREPNRVIAMPAFAAMIDIDAYQEAPKWPDPGDFVRTSLNEARRRLEDLVTRDR